MPVLNDVNILASSVISACHQKRTSTKELKSNPKLHQFLTSIVIRAHYGSFFMFLFIYSTIIIRRTTQMEQEIYRVNSNQTLSGIQKTNLIQEKHAALMKPVSILLNHNLLSMCFYPSKSFVNYKFLV